MKSAVTNKSNPDWIKIRVFFSYCCFHTEAFVRGASIFGLPTMTGVCMNHADLCSPRDHGTPTRHRHRGRNPVNSCEREKHWEPASTSWAHLKSLHRRLRSSRPQNVYDCAKLRVPRDHGPPTPLLHHPPRRSICQDPTANLIARMTKSPS